MGKADLVTACRSIWLLMAASQLSTPKLVAFLTTGEGLLSEDDHPSVNGGNGALPSLY